MKWLVFVEGGLYSGNTGEEGVRVIEIEALDQMHVWNRLMDRGSLSLCGDRMDDVEIDGLKGTKLRVFKAEEVPFTFLDAYVAERELREANDRENRRRRAKENELLKLAAELGYRIEKA